jgi:hypothetical protein
MEADYRVHLAHPAAMQQYSGLQHTDDRSDARWLAHLLRLGGLLEGYIYTCSTTALLTSAEDISGHGGEMSVPLPRSASSSRVPTPP